MKTAVIQNNSLLNSGRIDPSYHLSESIKLKKQLLGSPYTLSTVGKKSEDVFLGNIFTRVFVKDAEYGIPYIAASDMTKANIDSGKFISKKQAKKINRLMLDTNWILISCSGTLGNVVYTNDLFKNTFATHDLIRLIPDEKKLPSGFLYTYLASKYGYTLLTQSGFGGVVKHINSEHIANIPIPLFPESKQQEIHNLIVESANLRVGANRLLEESKVLLDQEINTHFQKESFKVSSNNIKDIFYSLQCRLDPPALISDGVETINKLKSKGVVFKTLSECNTYVYRPGIFKRSYVEKGYPYIKGSELFDNNPFLRCQYLSKTKTPFVEQMLLKEDQILVTCAGSCGQIKLITKEFEDRGAIGSQDIIRVEAKDSLFTTEYLFIYFQLPFIFDYIQSMKYGSVIERIEPFHVESIPIFIPSEEVSKKITDKINTYKKYMYVAFNKESQAISLVEKEIESWQQS
ncbi:restriction endonuclease subunit S [Dysgonomonas sp. GY75]|uniref:methylation-associated defense system restriction endonuclease subunit S MAD5 n=1 Tax=Dysgonomonas sp. GY75 TaxID=2780419 RepID=UPI00188379FD|nr:restriction endonuclease subunit S [Dysgonomonas sp. GY75]MBF0649237.1 restriction endonuclease subunit S [Dysgonomonas sp. GY75]